MLAILIYICAVWMIGKGALMLYGKYVPVTARTAIEDENDKRAWCRENGIINIVWGVDFAFYATGTGRRRAGRFARPSALFLVRCCRICYTVVHCGCCNNLYMIYDLPLAAG